jgi:type IV pilus assembly protein PilM
VTRATVGVELGTTSVRAVVLDGTGPRIRSFAEVPLPEGAVDLGTVRDPAAVAGALRELRKSAHLPSRGLRVVVGSPRTLLRVVELAGVPAEEAGAALRLRAEELLGLDPSEVAIGHRVLDPEPGADPAAPVRVQAVAVPHAVVDGALAALRLAHLGASVVEPLPLALVRGGALDGGPESGARTVVWVGSSLTCVAVGVAGVTRFARTVGIGAGDVARIVSRELDVAPSDAALLLHLLATGAEPLDASDAARLAAASLSAERGLTQIVDEVRGSLQYWLRQRGAADVGDVVVCGPGASLPALPGRLADALGLPVRPAWVPERSRGRGSRRGPVPGFSAIAALGAALGGGAGVLDLTPRVERGPVRWPKFVAAGVVAVAWTGGVATLTTSNDEDLLAVRDRLEVVQGENRLRRAELLQGTSLAARAVELDAARAVVDTALGDDVDWVTVLAQLAASLPDGVTVELLEGQASEVPGNGQEVATALGDDEISAVVTDTVDVSATGDEGIAVVSFTVRAVDLATLADWVEALEAQDVFSTVWIHQARDEEGTVAATAEAVLTAGALTARSDDAGSAG